MQVRRRVPCGLSLKTRTTQELNAVDLIQTTEYIYRCLVQQAGTVVLLQQPAGVEVHPDVPLTLSHRQVGPTCGGPTWQGHKVREYKVRGGAGGVFRLVDNRRRFACLAQAGGEMGTHVCRMRPPPIKSSISR